MDGKRLIQKNDPSLRFRPAKSDILATAADFQSALIPDHTYYHSIHYRSLWYILSATKISIIFQVDQHEVVQIGVIFKWCISS